MDEMERIQQWQYYISSYMRQESTEGVDKKQLQRSFLSRNHAAATEGISEDDYKPKPLAYNEGLVIRICLNSSKMVFEKGTSEWFVYSNTTFDSEEDRVFHEEKQAFQRELRDERLKEKFVTNNSWMKGLSHEEVQAAKDEFQKWKEGGIGMVESQQQQQQQQPAQQPQAQQ